MTLSVVPPTPPTPSELPAAIRWTLTERLVATIETLQHVAEVASDGQHALTNPLEGQWLAGYRQACQDALDSHALHIQAATHVRATQGRTKAP